MDPRVVNPKRTSDVLGEQEDLARIMAEAHAIRARLLASGLRRLGRALSWPVRVAIVRPFRAWRRRERVRVGLGGLADNALHDIGMTRDRLPYLIARERDRRAA